MQKFQKQFRKKQQTRNLNGYKNLHFGPNKVTITFDKIGRICDIQPRINDLLNTYRGRQRNSIPEIINYLNSINYAQTQGLSQ